MTRAAILGAGASRRRAGSSGGEIVFEGPITVSSGQTITNRHFESTSTTPAVRVNTTSPVVLEHCTIRHRAHGIIEGQSGCQVTIRNCKIIGTDPGTSDFLQRAITFYRPASLIVERNTLTNGHGIFVQADGNTVGTIKIRYNDAINIARYGNGGELVQFVQFNTVISNAEIAWNRVVNTYGLSEVEDNINMFDASGLGTGTSQSIWIHHNLIVGGYARTGNGSGYSGGGIMLGDEDGNYQIAEFNRVVSTSNYGIAIVGGHDSHIRNNRLVNDGRTGAAGTTTPTATSPGQAHNIGLADGQNHFNVGIGFTTGHVDISPTQLRDGYSTTANGPAYALNAAKTAVRMRAPVAGGTTSSGTSYARTEYREFDEAGTARAAWRPDQGTHYLKGRTKLIHLAPVKPWVSIAQIHSAEDDEVQILTRVQSGALRLMAYINGTTVTNPYMLDSVAVGDTIDWEIRLVNGVLSILINGVDKLAGFTSLKNTYANYTTSDMYFKAGCYNQSNWRSDGSGTETSQNEYFEVELSGLEHWHTGWPTAQGSTPGTTDPLPSTHGPDFAVGIPLWQPEGNTTGPNVTATNNVTGWMNPVSGERNDTWMPSATSSSGNTSLTSDSDAPVTAAHEQAEQDGWAFDLANAGLTVGADW